MHNGFVTFHHSALLSPRLAMLHLILTPKQSSAKKKERKTKNNVVTHRQRLDGQDTEKMMIAARSREEWKRIFCLLHIVQ